MTAATKDEGRREGAADPSPRYPFSSKSMQSWLPIDLSPPPVMLGALMKNMVVCGKTALNCKGEHSVGDDMGMGRADKGAHL